MPVETLIKEGDCLDVLQSQPSSSIDLMITSPHMQIAGKVLTEAFIRIAMSNGFCRAPSNSCACLSQQALFCLISKKRWSMESAIPMCWNSSWRFANKGGYGQKNISGIKEIV